MSSPLHAVVDVLSYGVRDVSIRSEDGRDFKLVPEYAGSGWDITKAGWCARYKHTLTSPMQRHIAGAGSTAQSHVNRDAIQGLWTGT